jgi:DNA-binding NarL/FixJ family response regulator
MKLNDLTRAFHVVVLTSSHSDVHFREALYLRADGYIVKPIDFQNFSAVTPQLNFPWALLKQESTT